MPALGWRLSLSLLSACEKQASDPAGHPAYARTEIAGRRLGKASLQTGEVQARYRAELAFRVSGRVIARLVEVGAHVEADQVLARLDPSGQQADLDAEPRPSRLRSLSCALPRRRFSDRRRRSDMVSRPTWHSTKRSRAEK